MYSPQQSSPRNSFRKKFKRGRKKLPCAAVPLFFAISLIMLVPVFWGHRSISSDAPGGAGRRQDFIAPVRPERRRAGNARLDRLLRLDRRFDAALSDLTEEFIAGAGFSAKERLVDHMQQLVRRQRSRAGGVRGEDEGAEGSQEDDAEDDGKKGDEAEGSEDDDADGNKEDDAVAIGNKDDDADGSKDADAVGSQEDDADGNKDADDDGSKDADAIGNKDDDADGSKDDDADGSKEDDADGNKDGDGDGNKDDDGDVNGDDKADGNKDIRVVSKDEDGDVKNSSAYAYVFMVGGVNEKQPGYLGFLYNILVASEVLREHGSKADVVAFFQFVAESDLDELPAKEVRLLVAQNIKVKYLPKPTGEFTYYDLQLEKFRILTLTQYRRVLYVDSDILPLNNLDYVFDLSDGPDATLKENMVVATRGEPSTGGFFMLRPGAGEYEQLRGIIAQQMHDAKDLPHPKFHTVKGWGHNFKAAGDRWRSVKETGNMWVYWGAHCDQGLLYYWVRYVKREASLVIGKTVHNWSTDAQGEHFLEQKLTQPLNELPERYGAFRPIASMKGPLTVSDNRPYTDYAHFAGETKPWRIDLPPGNCLEKSYAPESAAHTWFHAFCRLNNKLQMGLDMDDWDFERHRIGDAPLGNVPDWAAMSRRVTQTAADQVAHTTAAAAEARNSTHPTVAYAISLIKCPAGSSAGLIDASLVLRHSIHQNSVRNPASGSKYDYRMYAIVHEQARSCADVVEQAGFTVLVRKPPVQRKEIRGDYLRNNIRKEVCCGADEFVKLYALLLFEEEVVVHLDIDFLVHRPMDAVIDVMRGEEGARRHVPLEANGTWPEGRIDAMITRDWPEVRNVGRKAGFQAGFWVLRPSQEHFDNLLEIIREGNYVPGYSHQNGWGGQGYGGFIGARAMQGLLAYYYDIVVPGTSVELNHCRFNHIGVTTKIGKKCRNNKKECEECRTTPVADIYSVHYTACRKPWTCTALGSRDPRHDRLPKFAVPEDIVSLDHCMALLRLWHAHRTDMEEKLWAAVGDDAIRAGQAGAYNRASFQGHCTEDQSVGYLPLAGGKADILKQLPTLVYAS